MVDNTCQAVRRNVEQTRSSGMDELRGRRQGRRGGRTARETGRENSEGERREEWRRVRGIREYMNENLLGNEDEPRM